MEAYQAAGYDIHGLYMFCPPEVAAERAVGRFMRGVKGNNTGRYVPPAYVLGSDSNEYSFDALQPLFSKWEVYESMCDDPPCRVAGSEEHE